MKRKNKQPVNQSPNFIDLRGTTAKPINELIHDVYHPAFRRYDRWVMRQFHSLNRRWLLVGGLLVGCAIASLVVALPDRSPSPVPNTVSQAVSFPIFYPDANKLPSGYSLDEQSFSASNQAVLYKINGTENQKLTVSVQARPTDAQLNTFYRQTIPLNTQVTSGIGTATIGAIKTNAIVSLPTNDKSWILITAPADIDQAKLHQVIKAFVKNR